VPSPERTADEGYCLGASTPCRRSALTVLVALTSPMPISDSSVVGLVIVTVTLISRGLATETIPWAPLLAR
jgi:hypothetical protein